MRLLKLYSNSARLPKRAALLLTLTGGVLLSACASMPELPTQEIKYADEAITRAEEARVADYASMELRKAREKLVQARELSSKAQMHKDKHAALSAQRLAEQAKSDAELATAKAQEAKAKEANKEIKRSVEALDNVLQRQGGLQ